MNALPIRPRSATDPSSRICARTHMVALRTLPGTRAGSHRNSTSAAKHMQDALLAEAAEELTDMRRQYRKASTELEGVQQLEQPGKQPAG